MDVGEPDSAGTTTAPAVVHGRPIRRTVELGCGTGASTRWLASVPGVVEAVGVDLVPGTIDAATATAQAEASSAKFVAADVFDLPTWLTADARFDLLVDCQCFHCTRTVDEVAAVQAMASLLAPGGILLCLTGNAEEPEVGPVVLTRAEITHAFEGSGLFEIVSLKAGRFDPTPVYETLERLPLCWELIARRK